VTRSPLGDPGPAGPARTIFFGSGAFAVPILEALLGDELVQVVGVVSAPDRPAGRGGASTSVPVAIRAREAGVALLQPVRLREADPIAAIGGLEPDLGVLADYGRLVPPEVLELPARGFLNLHPSLLPRHRGAAPIPAAILAGDPETGVTLMRMDAGLDTGPVIAAERWPLTGLETAPEIEDQAAMAGARLLTAMLPDWLAGRIEPRPQDEALATLTKPLRRADGRLDPSQPSAELERRVRALQPWPGTFLELRGGGRVAIHQAALEPGDPGDRAGTLVAAGDGVALVTADARLQLSEVQPAGGRRMSGAEWRRGRPGIIGSSVDGS